MTRRVISRIINGKYIRYEDGGTTPSQAKGDDYFHGVAPSDLARLSDDKLYTSAVRLHESVQSGTGTASERANAQEALAECYRERRRRSATIR